MSKQVTNNLEWVREDVYPVSDRDNIKVYRATAPMLIYELIKKEEPPEIRFKLTYGPIPVTDKGGIVEKGVGYYFGNISLEEAKERVEKRNEEYVKDLLEYERKVGS